VNNLAEQTRPRRSIANGYQIVVYGSNLSGVGGTSEAAPLYGALFAIINDRLAQRVGFGDFAGFLVRDLHRGEHRFDGRDPEIRQLVARAWADRIVTTVLIHHQFPHCPASIILRGPPAFHA
jgi:hypothetical protein